MINHDEKKIEELIAFDDVYHKDIDYGGTPIYVSIKGQINRAIEQYAEYMVQQERERIIEKITTLGFICDTKDYELGRAYEKGCYEAKQDIINLINKEDELRKKYKI